MCDVTVIHEEGVHRFGRNVVNVKGKRNRSSLTLTWC